MFDATIVIPCFKRPEILRKNLFYLMKQTCPHNKFEVILIDDSGPENYEMIRGVYNEAGVDFELKYFTTDLPEDVYGVTVARNIGIENASSELIIFTDDDCWAHPNWVEEHIKWHNETDRLMLTGYRADHVDILEMPLPIEMKREKCIKEHKKSLENKLGAGDFKTGNASVKKKHLLEVGCFNEEMAQKGEYGYTDREIAMRLLVNKMIFKFNPDAAVYVVPHDEESMKKIFTSGARDKARKRFKSIEKKFKKNALKHKLKKFFRL